MLEKTQPNPAKKMEKEASGKIVIRLPINEIDAADLLRQFNAPFPTAADIDEIHLIIAKEAA